MTRRLLRAICGPLFAGLLGLATSALADTSQLYRASGMETHQAHFQQALEKARSRYAAQLPAAVAENLVRKSNERFEPERMHARAMASLAVNLSDEQLTDAREFYRSELGQAVVAAETRATSPAEVSRMQNGLPPLTLSAEREVHFRRALDLARADSARKAGEKAGLDVASAPSPGFEVEVDIAPEIRESFPPSTLVFILARAPGARMPLAVVRRQLGELPVTVVLDDSTAMNPARRLSTAPAVEIVARTAIGGSTARSDDDLEVVAGPFRLDSGITVVSLLLTDRAL